MTPDLGIAQIALAATALVINAAISLALSLGMARSLAIAALRMVVQLTLLALVLRWLFAVDSGWVTLAAMAVMGGFAGYEVTARQSHDAGRVWTGLLGTSVMLGAGFILVLPALALVLRADPWLAPRVALPMFGMVAGNAMSAVALTLNGISTALMREAPVIEARLAMGQPRLTALGDVLRAGIRAGMLPTIAAMGAIGVVTIPGMMTGQLLAGADPMRAAQYQMVIMFLIAGAAGLGVLASAFALVLRVTDSRHRLRLERLSAGGGRT